ncbi:MAG TPA: adenylate/guanylate cyclase domain-containing protein [Saprospiraceae bacterium]|nr:adenylate/guanylate cyclase domain-containing protein [Saprospiraceae bacterium]
MKLPFILTFYGLWLSALLYSQDQNFIDSCLAEIPKAKNDTQALYLYNQILFVHTYYKPEDGLKYELPALQVAERMKWSVGMAMVKTYVGRIHWRKGNFNEALKYHLDALKVYEESGQKDHIIDALMYIGQDYGDGGNYADALTYLSKALKISKETGNKSQQGYLYFIFSWVYDQQGNYLQSTKENIEALKIYEELGDSLSIAIAINNIGEDMQSLGNYDEAIHYFTRALDLQEKLDEKMNSGYTYISLGNAYSLSGNAVAALKNYSAALTIATEINDSFMASDAYQKIGKVYMAQGKYSEALDNFLRAVNGFKSVSNRQELAGVYSQIGTCFTRLQKYNDAEKYFADALALSNELDSKRSFGDYYKGIEMLDSAMGRWQNAYLNHKQYITLRDSMLNYESAKNMVAAQLEYEEEKKDLAERAEQEKKDILQRTIRNSITATLAGSLIFLTVVYRQRNKISKAHKRSDELLLNILPGEVAEELKQKGRAEAKHFDDVTVMFTDFKDFTQISEKLSPAELVSEIDSCFKAFDHIITKYNIEKIKTIGDSYMCAGGLPVANTTHAEDVVRAALEIQQFMLGHLEQRKKEGKDIFEIRIGIHSGPVVAGIVGIKKFAYDIWGDTVNIASRMESSGEAGKVNISGNTYLGVKDLFHCIHRGKIQAKNKGEIDMYFVVHGINFDQK